MQLTTGQPPPPPSKTDDFLKTRADITRILFLITSIYYWSGTITQLWEFHSTHTINQPPTNSYCPSVEYARGCGGSTSFNIRFLSASRRTSRRSDKSKYWIPLRDPNKDPRGSILDPPKHIITAYYTPLPQSLTQDIPNLTLFLTNPIRHLFLNHDRTISRRLLS